MEEAPLRIHGIVVACDDGDKGVLVCEHVCA